MVQFETWLKSDLSKPTEVKILPGNLFSGDNNANLIGVVVTQDGEPVALSGSIFGFVIRQDGVTVPIDGELEDNRAWIVLPSSAYVVNGLVSIVIKAGAVTLGACSTTVYRTTTDSIVDPGTVVPDISELLAAVAACEAATAAAQELLDQFSPITHDEMKAILDNAFGVSTSAIRYAILKNANATKANVIYNDTGETDSRGIPANSVCALFTGGNAQSVAEVVKEMIPADVGTYGNLSVDVDGDTINIQRATKKNATVAITLKALSGYDSSVADAIKDAVVAYFDSLTFGQDAVVADMVKAASAVGSSFTITAATMSYNGATTTDRLTCNWKELYSTKVANITITAT